MQLTHNFAMTQDEVLENIDTLMDDGASIGIRISRLDPALADAFYEHINAWRALAHKAVGRSDDGLDALGRYYARKGE